ncbi:DUF6541 family protein [Pseudarthrobacter sp. NPDC092439]|uniref:DUF6541 family protein n=1 Tax=unclassified Pseudarthrobacter TaxID=2647000 RepID=UPI00381C8015
MLDWLPGLAPSVPTVMLLTAVFFVPGLLVLLPFKPGWPAAVAVAPAVSLAVLSAGTFVAAGTGLPWNLPTAALLTVPAAGGAWLAGRRLPFRTPLVPGVSLPRGRGLRARPISLAVGAGVAFAAAVTSVALLRGIGSPGTASQGWDPVFHLNVLRWIQESGAATPWSVAPLFGAGRPTYYPAGWHSAVALVPGSVAETANLSSVVIGGLAWPIGLAFLAMAVLPRHRAAWALAPVIGASFVSFPFSQLVRSGQWPNGLGTALVPAALAVAVLLLRELSTPKEGAVRDRLLLTSVLLAAMAGCAAAHPSTLFALAAAALPFMVAAAVPMLVRGIRHRPLRTAATAVVLAALAAAAVAAVTNSRILAGVMAYPRTVRAEIPDSLYLAFFDLPRFPRLSPPAPDDFNLAIGILVIAGAMLALAVREARPLAAAWLVFAGLYVLAAGPENSLRWLTGFWYKDTQRIAPFIAMAGSLLAALALAVLVPASLRPLLRRLPERSVRRRVPAGAVALTAALAAAGWGLYASSGNFRSVERVAVTAQNYEASSRPGHGILSSGEQAFIERAGAMLPPDAVVVGDPFNGETYFYALTGRRVVYTQLGSASTGSAAKELLRTRFNKLATDPAVCEALRTLGATHFYQDAPGRSHGSASLKQWPGFYNVPIGQGIEEALSDGKRTLYRITACSP